MRCDAIYVRTQSFVLPVSFSHPCNAIPLFSSVIARDGARDRPQGLQAASDRPLPPPASSSSFSVIPVSLTGSVPAGAAIPPNCVTGRQRGEERGEHPRPGFAAVACIIPRSHSLPSVSIAGAQLTHRHLVRSNFYVRNRRNEPKSNCEEKTLLAPVNVKTLLRTEGPTVTELTCSSYLTVDGVCVRMRVRTSSVYVILLELVRTKTYHVVAMQANQWPKLRHQRTLEGSSSAARETHARMQSSEQERACNHAMQTPLVIAPRA